MIGSCVDFPFAPSADDVARAVLVGTEVRTSPVHLLGLVWIVGIEGGIRTLRVACHSPRRRQLLVVVRAIPVAGPLPYVACHVVQPVSVGRILGYGSNADVTVLSGVFIWEMSLVGVGHPLAVGPERFTPHERLA